MRQVLAVLLAVGATSALLAGLLWSGQASRPAREESARAAPAPPVGRAPEPPPATAGDLSPATAVDLTPMTRSTDSSIVAGTERRLILLDLAYPPEPQRLADVRLPEALPQRLALHDGRAYVTDFPRGLRIVDPREPRGRAPEMGHFAVPNALAIVIDEHVAYVAAGRQGLRILDLSAPDGPMELATLTVPRAAAGVALASATAASLGSPPPPGPSKLAYVAGASAGLRVVDVSDPRRPHEVGTVQTAGFVQDVVALPKPAADGRRYVYMMDTAWGLVVVDVTEPAAPRAVSAHPLADAGWPRVQLVVADSLLYVVERTGLRILDVSDPRHPRAVGQYATRTQPARFALGGGYAYLAESNCGLWVLDVRDRAEPRPVTLLPVIGTVMDLALDGSTAYILVVPDEALTSCAWQE